MVEIVERYKLLKSQMKLLIDKSGYKNVFLASAIGMPTANFSMKKMRGSWTEDEIEKILRIIESERLEDEMFLELMRAEKNSERMSVEELLK